jgi:hypothetical protein
MVFENRRMCQEMTEENVFHWSIEKEHRDRIARMPAWAMVQGGCVNYANPLIIPEWVRGDYQVAQDFVRKCVCEEPELWLYVRVKYPKGVSKWMPYIILMERDFYLIPTIVEYLLSGNAERVYESFVKERGWTNQRRD